MAGGYKLPRQEAGLEAATRSVAARVHGTRLEPALGRPRERDPATTRVGPLPPRAARASPSAGAGGPRGSRGRGFGHPGDPPRAPGTPPSAPPAVGRHKHPATTAAPLVSIAGSARSPPRWRAPPRFPSPGAQPSCSAASTRPTLRSARYKSFDGTQTTTAAAALPTAVGGREARSSSPVRRICSAAPARAARPLTSCR